MLRRPIEFTLRASIGVVDCTLGQRMALAAPVGDGVADRRLDEPGVLARRALPAGDQPSGGVDDERGVAEPAPGHGHVDDSGREHSSVYPSASISFTMRASEEIGAAAAADRVTIVSSGDPEFADNLDKAARNAAAAGTHVAVGRIKHAGTNTPHGILLGLGRLCGACFG